MNNNAKKVYLALVFLLVFHSTAQAENLGLVRAAQAELGNGETSGDNRGSDILRYTGKEGLSWCAGFVSYCMRQAGYDTNILSARAFLSQGIHVITPEPGDIMVLWRGKRNGWQGHTGIVESISGDKIIVIEGNSGEYPAKVKRVVYTGNPARLLAWVRVK